MELACMNRLKPGHDEKARSGKSQNSAGHGYMVACWQNGCRVLMHSSEVARLMKKEPDLSSPGAQAGSSRREQSNLPISDKPGIGSTSATLAHNLAPPPIVPRRPALAENASWQMLAKEIVRAGGHPRHCHKRRCRRSGKCEGGDGACYLRDFETVDIVMQRDVLPGLRAIKERSTQ
jgi:hypothetical protein